MSSTLITPRYLDYFFLEEYKYKVSGFTPDIQQIIADRYDEKSEDGWRCHFSNEYIKDLTSPAADVKNEDMHKLVAEMIRQRKQQHHNPDNEITYTLRQMDHCYVMRQERSKHRRNREVEAINYGTVYNYTSARAVRDTRFAAERNDRLLSKKYLKLSSDKFIPLNEVVQKSREHHTYATLHRLSSLAEIMTIKGWQASFTVQTVPSRMHPKRTIKKGDKRILIPNPKFDGTMPDQSHAWANKKWANVLSTLGQMGYEEGEDWMLGRSQELTRFCS